MLNTDNYRYEILGENTLHSILFQPEQLSLQLYPMPSDGHHPKHPVYTDYPALLPDSTPFDMQLLVNAAIWLILLILLGIAVWQIRRK